MFPSDKRILVCGRVDDPHCKPSVGSVEMTCCDCGAAIMASQQTQAEVKVMQTPVACVQCFVRHRDAGNVFIVYRQTPPRVNPL